MTVVIRRLCIVLVILFEVVTLIINNIFDKMVGLFLFNYIATGVDVSKSDWVWLLA